MNSTLGSVVPLTMFLSYVQSKGCGYPPRVVCEEFYQEFGEVGYNFWGGGGCLTFISMGIWFPMVFLAGWPQVPLLLLPKRTWSGHDRARLQ